MVPTPPAQQLNREPSEMPRTAGTPSLSVVVVSERDLTLLEEALAALLPACRELSARVVVVRAAHSASPNHAWQAEAGLQVVHAPAGLSTAELRSFGMAQASGDIVTLVEDWQAVGRNWSDILLRRSGKVTGPIPDGVLDR
jgi:hypothetical protein